MASGEGQADSNRKIAEVASRVFATRISEFGVVTEDLERATDPTKTDMSVLHHLGPVIEAGVSRTISNAELADNPLAVWIETRLGLDRPDGTKWVRARPRTLADATAQLAADSRRSVEACEAAIKSLLLVAAMPERDRDWQPRLRRVLLRVQTAPVLSAALGRLHDARAAGQRTVSAGWAAVPARATRRSGCTRHTSAATAGRSTIRCAFGAKSAQAVVLARDIDDMPARREDADGLSATAKRTPKSNARLRDPDPVSEGQEPDFRFEGRGGGLP